MAILTMKRIEILAMLTDSKAIVDYVQRQGSVEIDDFHEEEGHFYKLSTASVISQFERFNDAAENALAVLNKYTDAKGGGLLASFDPRTEIPISEYLEKSAKVDATLSKCYTINALSKGIQDCNVKIVKDETSIDQLRPWEKLDISPLTRRTGQTAIFIGSFSDAEDRESVLSKLAAVNPELNGEVEIVSGDKNQTCIVAVCHKDDADEFEQALHGIGFINLSYSGKLLPREQMAALQDDIEAQKKEIAAKEAQIKMFADMRKDIYFLQDYFALRRDKYHALDRISMDDKVFILTGYIAEEHADKLVRTLEKKFDVAISLTDVDPEDDEVPVEVENKRMGQTMESITNMYSIPSHRDIDPNFVMTIFYYCLFGLMLGDAGYGLVMVILCSIVKIKKKHMEAKKLALVNYGLYCGIGTTVWGALQNSWFGDLPKYLANGLKNNNPTDYVSAHHLYWFEPLANDNISRFLLLCFFIGILHLSFAICINIYNNCRRKNVFNAIVDNVPVLLVLIGVIPVINTYIGGTALHDSPSTRPIDDFITSASGVFYGILIAGAVLIILGPAFKAIKEKKSFGKVLLAIPGGLYGLYNAASGYLGDILSYARLLALGLCTGVIASVINQLAATPLGGNPIIFILIFLVGHTVNMAINLIGAYVHTNRLQYVEFFSKFYEGGGKPFRPLAVNTKTFCFKEEV